MAIDHARPGQPVDVQPLGAGLSAAASVALFKSDQLEVMRLVLRRGKTLPSHQVPGELTIHCLEGRLTVGLEAGDRVLEAGQLMFLKGEAPHALTALEDASALVTVVLGPRAGR